MLRLATCLIILGCSASFAYAGTLEDVKSNGFVKCGISQGLAGFSSVDSSGDYKGFDVDFCRGVAAAVGVDIKYLPTSAKDRFPALQSGETDLLYRNTTYTASRDIKLGLDFVAVNYYDGQGFMVRKSLGVTSALELNGATVCVNTGTTTELNLADYFRKHDMDYTPVLYEKTEEVKRAYESNRCDVYTTDASGLAAQRSQFKNPEDHIILPEIISKEPLGPAVRQGDDVWADIVRWAYYCTVNAEELGITQRNVKSQASNSEDPKVQRLLGKSGTFGADLGIGNDWCAKIIAETGNYGEIFARNLGTDTPLNIARGVNALWTDGGLQYGIPVR